MHTVLEQSCSDTPSNMSVTCRVTYTVLEQSCRSEVSVMISIEPEFNFIINWNIYIFKITIAQSRLEPCHIPMPTALNSDQLQPIIPFAFSLCLMISVPVLSSVPDIGSETPQVSIISLNTKIVEAKERMKVKV